MGYNGLRLKDGGRLTDGSLGKGIRKEKCGKVEEPNGVGFLSILAF